jgi:hypothetical protein
MAVRVPLQTRSALADGLLTIGVPFAPGVLRAGGGLVLQHEGLALPTWTTERARWPDGSLKWVFLHARVPAGTCELELVPGGSDAPGPLVDHGSLSLGGCHLRRSGAGWVFDAPTGSWELRSSVVDTDLPLAHAPEVARLTLLEASPIAPLARLRCAESTEGVVVDDLLRLDAVHDRLVWTRRVTWYAEGDFELRHLGADLRAIGGAFDPVEIVAPAPGRLFSDDWDDGEGYPMGVLAGPTHALFLEHAWQKAPFALRADGEAVAVDTYAPEAGPQAVKGGTSFRHTVELACGPAAADAAGASVEVVIDPAYLCATGAIGTIAPATAVRADFPGYETAFRATLETGRLTQLDGPQNEAGPAAPLEEESRQDEEYFGLPHYGDWPMPWGSYGGTRRMYASNEYDPAYAYYQGYAIYGDPRFLAIGRVSAMHMTDVDTIAHTGDMRFHGYNESSEDHGWARAPGDLGHYWTDGYWMLHFVHGDPWAREAALAATGFIARRFAEGGTAYMRRVWAGGERSLGWPAVALMGSYEATGDAQLLATIQGLVDYMEGFTADPEREIEFESGTAQQPLVWWRTAMADGCKPFMVGVILEGLERFHRITGDPKAAACIERLARFLVERMWLEHEATFIYEWNAYNRGHRFAKPHSLIPLFVRGLGYAYELTGEERFREVSEKAFHGCLWTLYDPRSGGKSIGMMGRTLGAYVTMLQGWLDEERATYRASIPASTGGSFTWQGTSADLAGAPGVVAEGGAPRFDDGAVVSQGDSYLALAFTEGVNADAGRLRLRTRLLPDSGGYPGQRCFLHLCGEHLGEPALSLISFYSSLHARLSDRQGRLIEVAEGFQYGVDAKGRPLPEERHPPREWVEGEWFEVEVEWNAPGSMRLWFDGGLVDEKPLDRRLGGAFRRLYVGAKPGNWRARASVDLQELRLGSSTSTA